MRLTNRSNRSNRSRPALWILLSASLVTAVGIGCESDGNSSDSSARSTQSRESSVVVSDLATTTPTGATTSSQSSGPTADQPAQATPDAPVAQDAAPIVDGVVRPRTSPVLNRYQRTNGLTIEDLRLGEGAVCLPGSVITFRHRAFLLNGHLWEHSDGQEPPASVPLSRSMAGWREGIPGMRVGGIRRLIIPPALGFGMTGRRAPIDPQTNPDGQAWIVPPGSTLVFEIELLDAQIRTAPPAAPQAPAAPAAAPAVDPEDQNK